MTTKDTERAQEQAKAQLNSIVAMVERLEHCQKCAGDRGDCELTDEAVYKGINLFWKEGDEATEEEREQYHDEEEARQAINEDPLSVQVRSGWANSPEEMEAEEFEILLCTGGPACRIIGELDHGEPDNANLEYQDWFTPWQPYARTTDEEDKALLTYARHFYFGS